MVDVGKIPSPNNRKKVHYENGGTWDIVDVVLRVDQKHDNRFCEFAKQFKRTKSGLRHLWRFVKYKIRYKVDATGRQDILHPAALWERGWGDCKSKTVFITQVLKCLGIPYVIRFVSFDSDTTPTHVYPIALLDGREVIIDSVWDFFDREKVYTYKKDYKMTKISEISGTKLGKLPSSMRTPDRAREVSKYVTEVEEKRSFVSPQPEYNFRGKTVGEAKAQVLRRQLELLKAFNPKEEVSLNKALRLLDRSMKRGLEKSAVVSGVGVLESQAELAVAKALNTTLQDKYPAFSFQRTYAGIGATQSTLQLRSLITPQNKYYLGAGTPYEKTVADIACIVRDKLVQMMQTQVVENGVPQFATGVGPLGNFSYPIPTTQLKLAGSFKDVNILSNLGSTCSGLLTSTSGGTGFEALFYDFDYQLEFEKYIEEQSGVFMDYLQNQVLKEENQAGAGILYDWVNSVPNVSTNQFGASVLSKRAVQSQWLDNAAFLTGGDRSLLQDMARNTYIYTSGENPEDSLSSLYNAKRQIGEPITIILAVIGLIKAVIPIIVAAMGRSKQEGEILSPDRAVGFNPIGAGLMPNEDDWTSGDGNNGGTGLGLDQNTMIGLAAIGVGAYLYMNQSNKKSRKKRK
jgi:hypothetical protein